VDAFPILSVQQFYQQFYNAQFRTRPQYSDYSVGTSVVVIAPPPSPALGITFSNTGSTNIALKARGDVTITTGTLLLPGGTLVLSWYYDYDLLTYDWYAISDGTGGTLNVLQNVLSGV
jgi:hypothetical protein